MNLFHKQERHLILKECRLLSSFFWYEKKFRRTAMIKISLDKLSKPVLIPQRRNPIQTSNAKIPMNLQKRFKFFDWNLEFGF